MASMVNFGIDLGTSNSLIAKFEKGQVEVFKNPIGFKETLPSVVGFRNDRVLVGDQARVYAEKDAKSVVSRFKRKMGTTETFKIGSLKTSKSPIELSAIVLKELRAFVHSGEKVAAAVITIPASFDTVQSNATKDAGLQAGFTTVLLLQEPIAASLAYANKEKSVDLRNSQWLVYDLGGGTFDVALVKIVEGELTVVDHEGDNYLGGSDFDALIVEKLIVPELQKCGKFTDLLGALKSESGRHSRLWPVLLLKAEEAKIELSSKTSAEIDLGSIRELIDDEGNSIEPVITVTRSEFEFVIKSAIDATADMMKKILTRNSLQPQDLLFILMVGGATYTPFVRKRVEEVMGIAVNTNIDPTNAIAVGAAFFAGTKEIPIEKSAEKRAASGSHLVTVRTAYNRSSQELQEIFTAKVDGDIAGLNYRIVRDDGAFDSGIKRLSKRIMEDLPLREQAFNQFTLRIFDEQNNAVGEEIDPITIAQGRYSVAGQMLPEDLSLVRDDVAIKDTKLDQIFAKNSVLPGKKKRTVEIGKTIVKGSPDEIRIMIVEGPSENHSSTNKPIGILLVSGKQLSRDLLKGTEVDLTFELSESRDLTVSAYLNGTGQEFSQVFDPKPRAVPVRLLSEEILLLEGRLQDEQDDAEANSNREAADRLGKLVGQVQGLVLQSGKLKEDDVTDDRFKMEDQKRRLAQELHKLTSGKRVDQARAKYQESKAGAAAAVAESGNDRERHHLSEMLAQEPVIIHSTNSEKIQAAASEFDRIRFQILGRTPEFLMGMLGHLNERRVSMNDQAQAKLLFESGKRCIEAESWDELRQVNSRLWELMPDDERAADDMKFYTGIV